MDVYCSQCKRLTEVVLDHCVGDTLCSECGFVLQSDPNRSLSLSTFDPKGTTETDFPDKLNNNRVGGGGCGSSSERALVSGFKTIASMSERLGLAATIQDRANEIYKKVEDQKLGRGRNQNAMLAACLYIACRQEDKPRTVKEICSVANGATKKEVGRAKEYIIKKLELEVGESVDMGKTIHAGVFMRRFCSTLGLANQTVKAALEAAQKAEEFDIRRSPLSIAAAVIYIVTQLSDDKKTLKDISLVTGVAEGTIRSSYKDLYPHLVQIIPNWYAQTQDPSRITETLKLFSR